MGNDAGRDPEIRIADSDAGDGTTEGDLKDGCQMADEERARFEGFVGLISALSKEIQRIKMSEAAKLGIKGADVMLLFQLARHPHGLTSAELARHAGVTRAAVSRALVGLEESGFVEVRTGSDSGRYRATVVLAPRGRVAMESASKTIDRVVNKAGGVVGDADRATMYAALEAILVQLKNISHD